MRLPWPEIPYKDFVYYMQRHKSLRIPSSVGQAARLPSFGWQPLDSVRDCPELAEGQRGPLPYNFEIMRKNLRRCVYMELKLKLTGRA